MDQYEWEHMSHGERQRLLDDPQAGETTDAARALFDDVHDDQETWERMTPGQRTVALMRD